MEIQLKGKSYKIPWEFIIAPFLMLLTVFILFVTNGAQIKERYFNYSGQITAHPAASVVEATPGPTTAINPLPSAENIKSPKEISEKSSVNANKVNINKATLEELIALPYIGEVKAEAIISYRNENGPFAAIEDLEKIKGIGSKTLEKLRPLVTLE